MSLPEEKDVMIKEPWSMNNISPARIRTIENNDTYVSLRGDGISIAEFFDKDEKVLIYGYWPMGKAIARDIESKVRFMGFVDQNKTSEEEVIYNPMDDKLRKLLAGETSITIIVTPTFHYRSIYKMLKEIVPEARVLSLNEVTAALQMDYFFRITKENRLSVLSSHLKRRTNGFRNVLLVETPYALLLYMLYRGELRDTIVFMRGAAYDVSSILRYFEDQRICHCYVDNADHIEYQAAKNIMRAVSCRSFADGGEVFGQDTIPSCSLFFDNKFTLIEDGLISYMTTENARKQVDFPVEVLGWDEDVHRVLFTGISEIDKRLYEKAAIIDINKLWEAKSQREREEINQLFGFPRARLEDYMLNGRNKVLMTSNYYERGLCTQCQQKRIYEDILSNYNHNEIIIKPHPADGLKYEYLFPEIPIIRDQFPAELFMLNNLPVERLIGIDSNALATMGKVYTLDKYDNPFI